MRNCVFVHSSISSTIRAPPVQRGVEVAQFVESYFLLQDQGWFPLSIVGEPVR